VNARWDLLRNHMVSLLIVAAIPAVVWLAISFGKLSMLGVVAVIAVILAVYIGLRHPLWLYWGLAFVLAALPFGYFPGVHVPLYLPFVFGCVVAAIVHPRLARSMHPLEWAIIALIITSALSVIATGVNILAIAVFIKWLLATLAVLALLQLSPENMARFGRIFVIGAALNAIFGMYLVAFDPNSTSFRYLRVFGYAAEYTSTRFAFTDEGASRTVRLGGTWVDPNGAGICMLVALCLCVVLFTGWRRVVLASIITAALLLTLSRAGIFSVVAGVLLVLVFHGMRSRDRVLLLSGFGLAAVAALMAPPIRRRIFTSFRTDDAGSTSRLEALRDFPHQMSGNWLFGLGWGRQEFRDGEFAFTLNHVSNTPLLTIYRGGIITGLCFIAVMVIGGIMSYRALRSHSLPWAIYGGVFIGFCVVALNLDHPVVGIPQATLKFSILLAFLVYIDRARTEELRRHAYPQSEEKSPALAH
jgi:polysaccharide biosynthesis protein PslJ